MQGARVSNPGILSSEDRGQAHPGIKMPATQGRKQQAHLRDPSACMAHVSYVMPSFLGALSMEKLWMGALQGTWLGFWY